MKHDRGPNLRVGIGTTGKDISKFASTKCGYLQLGLTGNVLELS